MATSDQWKATLYTSGVEKSHDTVASLAARLIDETSIGNVADYQKAVLQPLTRWEDRIDWQSADRRKIGGKFDGKLAKSSAKSKPLVLLLGNSRKEAFYVSKVELWVEDPAKPEHIFPVNSWITQSQGPRIFFHSVAYTSRTLPAALVPWWNAELELLKPVGLKAEEQREGDERFYDYAPYNDLGIVPGRGNVLTNAIGGFVGGVINLVTFGLFKLLVNSVKGIVGALPPSPRPVLGGSQDLPYPRRIRTGGQLVGGSERRDGPPWLPLDEKFDETKEANFTTRGLIGVLPLVAKFIENLGVFNGQRFKDFTHLRGFYSDAPEFLPTNGEVGAVAPAPALPGKQAMRNAMLEALYDLDDLRTWKVLHAFGEDSEENVAEFNSRGRSKEDKDAPKEAHVEGVIEKLLNAIAPPLKDADALFAFTLPRVIYEREESGTAPAEWQTDKDFGRQVLSGQNACVLEAVTGALPADSAITDAVLKGVDAVERNGKQVPLADLIRQGRVFMVDYSSPKLLEYCDMVNAGKEKERCQYAGRCLLVLMEDSFPSGKKLPYLLPAAIELSTGTKAKTVVYTPNDGNVWLLAKTAFNSVDSSVHQLYSHFIRTHAAVEPYAIATRRNLSPLHPVYKLLMPHFRFMLNINAAARANLINAGGFIEQCFTPGQHSMAISSELYKQWTFDTQGLPGDLRRRKLLAKEGWGHSHLIDDKGLLLKDYPYADDGRLIWNALVKWVGRYLDIYAVDADDKQLVAWWDEIQNKGHPDIKQGWPDLKSRSDLVLILATIMWAASAHHAAVNFGQYDYSGWMPNHPSKVRKPIPVPGKPEYEAANKGGVDGEPFCRVFFETFSSPFESALIMAVVNLLSSHSENEQYLNDKEHFYIFDDKARKAYLEFVEEVTQAEHEMEARNKRGSAGESRVRGCNPAPGGMRGVDYTLLQAGPGEGKKGVLFRGVPNSISI